MYSKCIQKTTSESISPRKSQARHLQFEAFNSEHKKKLYIKYFISGLHFLKVTLYSYALYLPPPHWAVFLFLVLLFVTFKFSWRWMEALASFDYAFAICTAGLKSGHFSFPSWSKA